ncbi:MAG: VCBS repeat-containing protein [Flavobacteriaceae bacterium]
MELSPMFIQQLALICKLDHGKYKSVDFNNDGWIDFLWQNSKELWINDGDGTFSGYDVPFNEGGIGDLNNDGFLDVQTGGNVYYSVPNDNHWITINFLTEFKVIIMVLAQELSFMSLGKTDTRNKKVVTVLAIKVH